MQTPPDYLNKAGYLNKTSDLEDKVYLQVDKLVALCSMQAIADTSDCDVPMGLRTNYSAVLEEHAIHLRKLLDEVFEQEV